jgi:metallo-beta-lactamase family protein
MPVLKDLAAVKHADYVICEGTYGDRLHPKRDRQLALAEIINNAYQRALQADSKHGYGVIIIPAFAVGRVQSVLYDLRQLMADKRIPSIPVFVDSPMAIKANAIYRRHTELYNAQALKLLAGTDDLFATPRFAELSEWQQSVALDGPPSEPIIIVGSSGMAAGGRIVRHLENRLPGKQNTVVFIGYQGQGTLGNALVSPEVSTVHIAGKEVRVRATIEHMEDYSGHADYNDIVRWLRGFQAKPRKLFLVHGDEQSLTALAEHIENVLNWDVEVPRHRDFVDLD